MDKDLQYDECVEIYTFFYITLDGNFSYDGPSVSRRRGNVPPLAADNVATSAVQPRPVKRSTSACTDSTG